MLSRKQASSRRSAILCSLLLVALPACGGSSREGAGRPNFVVFLADDMGWGQVGFNGGREVPTPNIDRIADEGVKLTQFYVQPVCTPTRGALLTGRYAWRNGTEIRPRFWSQHGMLTDERTLPEVLRDAGYATWMVGKWHLGQWQQRHLPLERGFDHHYGHYSAQIDSFTHLREGVLDWHRNGRPVVEEGYSTFLLAGEASRLIRDHDGRRPFFLYVSFNAVHSPHQAPDEVLAKYEHLGARGAQRAQLECMDHAVGEIMRAIEEKGIDSDTLVLFTNDNGGTPIAGRNGPYRGYKSHFHEGGIRVPTALRWPGHIPPGSVSDELLHVTDVFPTLTGLAGARVEGALTLDGVDAWQTIARGAASPREEIALSLDVLRHGAWKLIEEGARYYDWPSQPLQLYDVAADPGERDNLAGRYPDVVEKLRARLEFHRRHARRGEVPSPIPGFPPVVYSERENAEYGAALRERLTPGASARGPRG